VVAYFVTIFVIRTHVFLTKRIFVKNSVTKSLQILKNNPHFLHKHKRLCAYQDYAKRKLFKARKNCRFFHFKVFTVRAGHAGSRVRKQLFEQNPCRLRVYCAKLDSRRKRNYAGVGTVRRADGMELVSRRSATLPDQNRAQLQATVRKLVGDSRRVGVCLAYNSIDYKQNCRGFRVDSGAGRNRNRLVCFGFATAWAKRNIATALFSNSTRRHLLQPSTDYAKLILASTVCKIYSHLIAPYVAKFLLQNTAKKPQFKKTAVLSFLICIVNK